MLQYKLISFEPSHTAVVTACPSTLWRMCGQAAHECNLQFPVCTYAVSPHIRQRVEGHAVTTAMCGGSKDINLYCSIAQEINM